MVKKIKEFKLTDKLKQDLKDIFPIINGQLEKLGISEATEAICQKTGFPNLQTNYIGNPITICYDGKKLTICDMSTKSEIYANIPKKSKIPAEILRANNFLQRYYK